MSRIPTLLDLLATAGAAPSVADDVVVISVGDDVVRLSPSVADDVPAVSVADDAPDVT